MVGKLWHILVICRHAVDCIDLRYVMRLDMQSQNGGVGVEKKNEVMRIPKWFFELLKVFIQVLSAPTEFFIGVKEHEQALSGKATGYYVASYSLLVLICVDVLKDIQNALAQQIEINNIASSIDLLNVSEMCWQVLRITFVFAVPLYLVFKFYGKRFKAALIVNQICYLMGTANVIFLLPVKYAMSGFIFHNITLVQALIIFGAIAFVIVVTAKLIRVMIECSAALSFFLSITYVGFEAFFNHLLSLAQKASV